MSYMRMLVCLARLLASLSPAFERDKRLRLNALRGVSQLSAWQEVSRPHAGMDLHNGAVCPPSMFSHLQPCYYFVETGLGQHGLAWLVPLTYWCATLLAI